ncbi:MAG: BamA/TamA family outer membrane protein [Rhizobacter sp.]|nr:BamA/TamA family outer membrane protein [Rhizobacter sp.]
MNRCAPRPGPSFGLPRHLRHRLLLCGPLLAMALAGCATHDDATTKPAPSPIELKVSAPKPLDDLLERNLDLGRLSVIAPGTTLGDAELDRLVAATPQQAKGLLETEGYFQPQVTVQRRPGEPSGGRPVVQVTVEPGPQVRVRNVDLQVTGPLAEATDQGDPHAFETRKAMQGGWPLPVGAPFRNPLWSSGKRDALAQLRAQAYLDADWQDTDARIDVAANAADLSLVADSGPLYRTGALRIRGLHFHDEKTVRNLADFDPGTLATETLLLDFQERLQNSSLFDRASVTVSPDAPDPSAAPVHVRLHERELQEATFGVGVSADVGARATVEHVHRRPFGWAALARNKLEISQLRYSWQGELSTHTLPGLWRNLIGGAAERIDSDTDTVSSARLRVGRAQDTRRIDRLLFVEFERSLRRTTSTREQANALGAHYHGIWRDVDSTLLPTRGRVWAGQLGAGVAESTPGARGPFTRLYGRFRGYWPLGHRWYSQARVELGQVFSADNVQVPESLRFRAGGDDSVRGYAYRSLTPQVDGVDTGGRVIFTSSVEVAHPLLERLPALWGAVFVDAGRAADRFRGLDPAVGAGVGLRYRSPIGPVSVDLAYGEEVRKFRLHVNVGVTF